MENRSAIVIGSGVAGLALATRLAIQGYKVKVFEKNTYPGGKLSAFDKDGFRFDAGPSLFTQPQNIEELFQAAGENINDYFWNIDTIGCYINRVELFLLYTIY